MFEETLEKALLQRFRQTVGADGVEALSGLLLGQTLPIATDAGASLFGGQGLRVDDCVVSIRVVHKHSFQAGKRGIISRKMRHGRFIGPTS
jgi:hypothetical protein